MASHSSNEESQNIDVNESYARKKKPKKNLSVGFSTDDASAERDPLLKSRWYDGQMSEDDIYTEICSLLPSNTLGRGKLFSLANNQVAKSLTLPSARTGTPDVPLSRLRPRSMVAKRSSHLLAAAGKHLKPASLFAAGETQDSTDTIGTYLTDEEKKKELLNIKNIPIRLSERKLYREAILETLPFHGPKEESCWSKFSDLCSCFKQFSSALGLWNSALKHIEGQQGTGVVSYFVFLRWLIALNLVLFVLYFVFVTFPQAAFLVLPLKEINTAPKETVVNEAFLNQFPSSSDTRFVPKKPKYSSLRMDDEDVISYLGTFFDKYLPDNILDVTLYYDKNNLTTAERHQISDYCEVRYTEEMQNRSMKALDLMQDLLQGTGWLESTILFLGYYRPNEVSYFKLRYNMPVAAIAVLFVSFVICLLLMIQYSSHGVQETILARKSNYLAYSNILFCSWDYCIEDRKSSIIRHKSILHEIKSTLTEERRKRDVIEWSESKKIKVYCSRVIVNIFVIIILCGSYYLIYRVVNYQLKELQLHRLNNPGVNTLFVQYLSPIVITALNIIIPIVFTNIVKFEMYATQTQINMALFRIVFLRLSSVFVLVGLLYQQITCEPKDKCRAGNNETCRTPICWETYVGQQLYKLAVTDFFVYIAMFVIYDVPRDLIVRRFKNKVTRLIGRQTFDLPNQVLALVYSQTLCWLGIIYSPLLPFITLLKFLTLFYIKKVMVLKFCIPAPVQYKASRSNAMFMMILMLSFFTLMIIHAYTLSSVEPSPACSPYRYYSSMMEALPDAVYLHAPKFASSMKFVFSALCLLPAIILLCIAIYYYWTIVVAHKKMVKVLKTQIALEGRDKQFLLNRLTEIAKGRINQ